MLDTSRLYAHLRGVLLECRHLKKLFTGVACVSACVCVRTPIHVAKNARTMLAVPCVHDVVSIPPVCTRVAKPTFLSHLGPILIIHRERQR